jgi:hypothetical protein
MSITIVRATHLCLQDLASRQAWWASASPSGRTRLALGCFVTSDFPTPPYLAQLIIHLIPHLFPLHSLQPSSLPTLDPNLQPLPLHLHSLFPVTHNSA